MILNLEEVCNLPANRAQYLAHVMRMLYDLFPYTVKCWIADALSHTVEPRLSELWKLVRIIGVRLIEVSHF